MSAINTAIDIDWSGKSYRSIINFAVIEKIEQDFNIVEFDIDIACGRVDCERVAMLITHILNNAGANVEFNQVGQAMFGENNDDSKHEATINLVKRILRLIFPTRNKKTLKKPENKPITDYKWSEFYKRLVAIEGISPSDFWKMTPVEAFLIIDTREPEEKIGSFTIDKFEELSKKYEELNNV